jgi:hypothetical protein
MNKITHRKDAKGREGLQRTISLFDAFAPLR